MYDFACQNCSASLIHRSWKLRCQIGKACGLSIPIRWAEPPLIICIAFSTRCLVTRREQYMQMLWHQRERVQFVESTITARNNLLHNDASQDGVDEKRVPFPCVCRHKVDTGLPNATRDFRHSRTARG